MGRRIIDWKRIWAQTILLIGVLIMPRTINLQRLLMPLLGNSKLNFDNAKYFFLIKAGNDVIGIALATALLFWGVRNWNKEAILNTGSIYHDHCFLGYWFCAKVLGFKTCDLVRVPICMQFMLVIHDTFRNYLVGEDSDYMCVENEAITVERTNNNDEEYTSTINLVLSDTYPITRGLLPASISNLDTIVISRGPERVRCYSESFCVEVEKTVRQLPAHVVGINLFSTLNPKHAKWIAKNVFKLGGRTNIRRLTVFRQPRVNGTWNFEEKGRVIYS